MGGARIGSASSGQKASPLPSPPVNPGAQCENGVTWATIVRDGARNATKGTEVVLDTSTEVAPAPAGCADVS